MSRDIKIGAGTLGDLHDEKRAERHALPMAHGLTDAEKQTWLAVDDYLRRNPGRRERDACVVLGVSWPFFLRIKQKCVASDTEALGGRSGARNERETK